MEVYDTVIVGSGAAGYAAALYAGRYLMKTLVIEGEFGGETATAGVIWNYPGVKGADGFELMVAMKEQAQDVGATVVDGRVTRVVNANGCFSVFVGDTEYLGKTIILTNGAERRRLGLPNEHELTSKGVHYCVTCDGPLYGGKVVAIVGGGDASIKGVNMVANYATKIYLIVRGTTLKAEPINLEAMKKLGDKVEILFETEVKEIVGTTKLEKIVLSKPVNGSTELPVEALFVQIGTKPDVELAQSIGVSLDSYGYMAVSATMETNVPGVYAAGDNVNLFGSFKQTITAAALGAVAATSAYNYSKAHGNLCEVHWVPEDTKVTA